MRAIERRKGARSCRIRRGRPEKLVVRLVQKVVRYGGARPPERRVHTKECRAQRAGWPHPCGLKRGSKRAYWSAGIGARHPPPGEASSVAVDAGPLRKRRLRPRCLS